MKKIGRRSVFIAIVAVILALGAMCFMACNGNEDGPKTQYTLTFMVGTTPYETVTAYEGSTYETKDDPYRANFAFEGWSLTPNGDVVELPATMPSENRTYYAIFSARYNLRLNAGIGSVSEENRILTVKQGDDLYEIVSEVTPVISDGDAVFAGWYLRGNEEITATSGHKMPGGDVEVVAKYKVDYAIDIYLETRFESGEYGEKSEVKSGSAFVGEKLSDLPVFTGYYYDSDKENAVLYTNLNKNSAQNSFSLYYKLLGYDLVFNANLPSEVEFEGEMSALTCGFEQKYETPDCGFTADGYRFQGWATTPDGEIKYRPGDEYAIGGATTFYAKWVKGLTELAGLSSDRVYIMNDHSDPSVTVAYLERFGLDDIRGEYDSESGIFTFKNENAVNPNAVMLRGIANIELGTFTYFNTVNETTYSLRSIDGTVDNATTLVLRDDGTAMYAESDNTFSGNYYAGSDGSMHFSSEDKKFAFRLVQSAGENSFGNFMIRGEEYGTWNNITQAGVVDVVYTLSIDGYGSASMRVLGLDSSSLSSVVAADFGGVYGYYAGEDAYVGEAGIEVAVVLYNSSLNYRSFVCLLMHGEYYTASDEETVYRNVYLERFSTTLYGAPADGEQLDKETADKIVLSDYGVLADSATYTYKNNGGETVTVKGKYEYDRTAGTLRITPESGSDYLFEVRMSDDEENPVPLFEPVQQLFGQYLVSGIDESFGPNGFYTMHVYNNNVAAFAFRIPTEDPFYGNILYEYTRMVFGEYSVASEGVDESGAPDEKGNVYEYRATVSPAIANYIYSLYYGLYGVPLDLMQFGSLRFQFVYSVQTGEITYVNAVNLGDFQEGKKITYDGVEYTLDGFGTAVGTTESGDEVKMAYTHDTMIGMQRLFVVPDASKPNATVVYIDASETGVYVEFESIYVVSNSDTTFCIIFFKDNTALLTLDVNARTFYPFSYGKITMDEDGVHGRYVRDESFDFGDIYVALNKTYSEFNFMFVTTREDGKEVTRLYIYNVDDNKFDNNGTLVIVNPNGDELTIDRNNVKATYVVKGDGEAGDTVISGDFNSYGDMLQLLYKSSESSDANDRMMTFKLNYSNGAITSFETVGNEAGYWLSGDDAKSYMYLSGLKADGSEDYAGTYFEYSEGENGEAVFTEHQGTYNRNEEGLGYDFTYATGAVDEENNPVTETFTFAMGTDAAGIPFFKKYVMALNTNVYYFNASYGQPVIIGSLSGGGYEAQTFTLIQTRYTGNMAWSEDALVWVFTTTSGDEFYFKILSGIGPFLLDNTYIAETRGVFELSEAMDIDVPATEGTPETEDTPAVDPVPAHTAHVTSIEMSGMAFAYLHYTYEGEERVITGIYMQYASNGFAFMMLGGEDENDIFQFRFRLMVHTEDGETRRYVAELANMDLFGTYVGDDLTVINLNGFTSAYYVDAYGRVYTGTFEKIAEDSNIIKITYIDIHNYTVRNVYVEVDYENRTFVTLDPDDDRIPQPPENGENAGYADNIAA